MPNRLRALSIALFDATRLDRSRIDSGAGRYTVS